VEGSDANVTLMREGFKRSGIAADVLIAQSSEQVVHMLADSSKPDFILLDTHLPELDGLKVLKHCRSLDGTPPIVMLSGSSNEYEKGCALELGACDYIVKPTSFADLVTMVKNVAAREDTDCGAWGSA
jgi:DNA-binding response OmpR family regulator